LSLWEKSKIANLETIFKQLKRRIKVDTIELTFGEEQRRTALVHKLIQGSICLTEAQELRTLLEKERHMLTQQRNFLAFFAARFLIDYVDEYLRSKKNSLLASGS
jgi:hypothetical protein